jgi:hypothetical protein
MKLDKFDWPAQEETLVKTVEAPTGSRKPHSWGKAGLADQVRRMRTTEQKDKEITKHA